jgi:hypothetical protein
MGSEQKAIVDMYCCLFRLVQAHVNNTYVGTLRINLEHKEVVGENASREECKQTKENAGSYYHLTKRRRPTCSRYVARMSPGRVNGRNVVSDVLLLKNVYGT